jgi:hypothetical protein
MPVNRALHLCAALLLLGACGGKSSSSPGSGGAGASAGVGGGGASFGGAGGSVGGAGGAGNLSGAGGEGPCGHRLPCSRPGAICLPEDQCCPCSFECIEGSWSPADCLPCEPPSCPTAPPEPGRPCDACDVLLGSACQYDGCPIGVVTLHCIDRTWQVDKIDPEACTNKQPCGWEPGSVPCPTGMLCLYPGGLGDWPRCEKNPCPPGEEVTCGCAGVLCTYGYCSNADAERVFCDCPTC